MMALFSFDPVGQLWDTKKHGVSHHSYYHKEKIRLASEDQTQGFERKSYVHYESEG